MSDLRVKKPFTRIRIIVQLLSLANKPLKVKNSEVVSETLDDKKINRKSAFVPT